MAVLRLEVLSFLISAGQAFIMVPGLALFYGGLVRHKNVILPEASPANRLPSPSYPVPLP